MGASESPEAHAAEAEAALARARALVAAPGPLGDATRAEVLGALDDLKKALGPALAARSGDVRSFSHFAEVVAHEATRPEPSPSLVKVGLDGLTQAAERLETQHPTLVGMAKRVADALAQIGI